MSEHVANLVFEAKIIDVGTREKAGLADWYDNVLNSQPDKQWVVGKYVEADNANSNKQLYPYVELERSAHTVTHMPMNVNHNQGEIVGTFVDYQMVIPEDKTQRPYMEVIGLLWPWVNPTSYQKVLNAAIEGNLNFSMECTPRSAIFRYPDGTSEEKALKAGEVSWDTYPDEYAKCVSMDYQDLKFKGGAIIIAPTTPGWAGAKAEFEVSEEKETGSDGNTENAKNKGVSENPDIPIETRDDKVLNEEAPADSPNKGDNIVSEAVEISAEQRKEIVDEFLTAFQGVEDQAAEIASLQTRIDEVEAAKAASEKSLADTIAYLEHTKAEEVAAAQKAELAEARSKRVLEETALGEDYVDVEIARWVELDDDSFEALMGTLKAVSESANKVGDSKGTETAGHRPSVGSGSGVSAGSPSASSLVADILNADSKEGK